jgi:hypothetical protein
MSPDERPPARRSPWRAGAALSLALAFGGCGLFRPDPAEICDDVLETGFSDLKDVAYGGTDWQGHDVWVSFRVASPPRLKKEQEFRLLSLADAKSFLKEAAPCRALLESPEPICLLRTDTRKQVLNGIVVVLSKDRTTGCLRSWEHR